MVALPCLHSWHTFYSQSLHGICVARMYVCRLEAVQGRLQTLGWLQEDGQLQANKLQEVLERRMQHMEGVIEAQFAYAFKLQGAVQQLAGEWCRRIDN